MSLNSIRESISTGSTRPLPLKQRTSSQDCRRDYSSHTWLSLLRLLKPREFFITVDNFSIWRRHLAWAMEGEGSDLRGYISQRYASSMVFMSLLLGTALNVLFNSDKEATDIRQYMREGDYASISFWAGFTMLLSVILTILSIISTFTAWGMVNAVSDVNAHCILRSSIGQYAAELPSRFIVASIYCFLIWFLMLCILLLPEGAWAYVVVAVSLALFLHVVSVFSAFGRIIMHAGAMGEVPIFEPDYERGLLPHGLHANLLAKATAQLESKTSIMRQYRYPSKPLSRSMTLFSVNSDLSSSTAPSAAVPPPPRAHNHHRRSSSTVRFADNLLSSSTPVVVDSPLSHDHNTSSMPRRSSYRAQRPPRPPQLSAANSSDSQASDGSKGADAVAVDWLQGSPSHGDASAGESVADMQEAPKKASAGAGHERIPSILLPSTYGPPSAAAISNTRPESNVETVDSRPLPKARKYWGSKTRVPRGALGKSAELMAEEDNDNTGAGPVSDHQPSKDPGTAQGASKKSSKSRKYFGDKTQSKPKPARQEEADTPVAPKSRKDTSQEAAMAAATDHQPKTAKGAPKKDSKPRKYFGDKIQSKPKSARFEEADTSAAPKSRKDTSQEAAMAAATDAYTRLLARPQSKRPDPVKKNTHVVQFSTDHKFYEEYGDIFDPETGAISDSSGGTGTSHSHDDFDSEQHPLLRDDERAITYDTVAPGWTQRTDHDKRKAGAEKGNGDG